MIELQKIQPILELYACVQSEGKLTGIPHILIRTTGCPLRCQFSDTDFCDSSYTSWNPEKGQFSLNSLIEIYKKYPHIKHTMITGGSPTMHKKLLPEMTRIAKQYGQYVTLETEGGHAYIEGVEIDLLSLSPKLDNSQPRVGTITPQGKKVTQKNLDQHNKNRKSYICMENWIVNSVDYQLKPVISHPGDLLEVESLKAKIGIPNNMIWLMPAGGTEEELKQKRQWLIEYCWANGYNYTDRIHITAYGEKRGV